jgi:hypothetical protein
MITEKDLQKVRELGSAFADHLALLPFDKAEELMIEFKDVVNECRDAYIERAYAAIERLTGQTQHPDTADKILRLTSMIEMMNGVKANG